MPVKNTAERYSFTIGLKLDTSHIATFKKSSKEAFLKILVLCVNFLFEVVKCYLFQIHLYKQNKKANNQHQKKVTFFSESVRDFNS